ncbi:hypothetical protein [Micromonospora sp. NPDC005171]|uniref:hypothetical protein n=1 Tax=Micromonospora sp. NPDC005171 TaxID=3156866 RepID=UPI0033AEB795
MPNLIDDHPARVGLAAAWESVHPQAAGDFWCTLEDRRPGAEGDQADPLLHVANLDA